MVDIGSMGVFYKLQDTIALLEHMKQAPQIIMSQAIFVRWVIIVLLVAVHQLLVILVIILMHMVALQSQTVRYVRKGSTVVHKDFPFLVGIVILDITVLKARIQLLQAIILVRLATIVCKV